MASSTINLNFYRCGLRGTPFAFEMVNAGRLLYQRRLDSIRAIHTSHSKSKIVPNNLKGKSKSSQDWLSRQLNDPYVKKAQELNYRARSAFKLIEIDDKTKILRPGITVVECGAAPGAWSQVIVSKINSDKRDARKRVGCVIGVDLLPIAPLKGATFLDGCDFTSLKTTEQIKNLLTTRCQTNHEKNKSTTISMENDNGSNTHAGKPFPNKNQTNSIPAGPTENSENGEFLVDAVLSDMAPNASGQREMDHFRIIKLAEAALFFAINNGKPGSHFLAKVWDGSELKNLETIVGKYYDKVSRQKPPSSRNDSAEVFILGKYKK